jgi:hypothetical protein
LVLTCVGFVFVAICLLIAYSFSGLYFVHNRLQTSADEIALTGAKKLNDRNRIGQMNNMIARCRQLVYCSRDDKNGVNKEFPEIERFADQLLDEARQSALELESERTKMRAVAEDEAVQAMRAKFNSIKNTYAMTLPWMQVRTPRVIGVGLGCIDGTESNVEEFDQFEKLKKSDRDQGNTVMYSKLNLYKGNKNQQLIEDDTDLPFFLSSLPPAIESEVSPARTILPDNYREADDEPVPTATKVTLDLQVENGVGPKTGGTMRAIGTAITTGASNQE